MLRKNDFSDVYAMLLRQYELVARVDLQTGVMDIYRSAGGIAVPDDGMDFYQYIDKLMQIVSDEDIDLVCKQLDPGNLREMLLSGSRGERCQFRICVPGTQEYFWFDASIEAMQQHPGRADALLTIRNINMRYIERVEEDNRLLEAKAARDPLTDVYNKSAVADLISSYIEGEGAKSRHALLFCDLDSFKLVNDRFGHFFGDTVIREISGAMVSCFRSGDIIGRVGGDEFIVLIKNIHRREDIINAARKLCAATRKNFSYCDGTLETSASVGIAIYPDDGTDYATLYSCADWAMYSIKSERAGGYRFFDEASGLSDVFSVRSIDDLSEREHFGSAPGQIDDYMLNLLVETPDPAVSVPRIMQLLGKRFGISRVYSVLVGDDGALHLCNYWLDDGVANLTTDVNIFNLAQENIERALKPGQTLMYCRDTHQTSEELHSLLDTSNPGVRAFIQCAILDDGKFKGFVGFDDCHSPRIWTEEESQKLNYLTKLLRIIYKL